MIKTLILTVFLIALCSARLNIPIRQHSNSKNLPKSVSAADDEKSKTLKLTAKNTANIYFGDLYVGESHQFSVLFATARDETWIPGYYTCKGCPSQSYYYCDQSPTCDRTDEFATLDYPQGQVTGHFGHEMIGVTRDFQVKSQILWATEAHRYNDSHYGFYAQVDGFLGLGSNQSVDGFIDLAYQQNYIQDKVFSFTLDLNFDIWKATDTSYLSVGYIPTDKVNKLTWVPLKSSSNYSWAMSVSSTKVGDKIVDTSSEPFSDEVIIDSGVVHLCLTRSIIQELRSQLEKFITDEIHGNVGPFYICNDNYIQEFPNITLKVAGMHIVLNPWTYLDFSAISFSEKSNIKHACFLNAQESQIGAQVLGSNFLFNNFVAFSKANQTVGIYPEYKPRWVGVYKTPLQQALPFVLGAVLIIIIIVVVKKKRANNLQKELSGNSNDIYSSKIGINN